MRRAVVALAVLQAACIWWMAREYDRLCRDYQRLARSHRDLHRTVRSVP